MTAPQPSATDTGSTSLGAARRAQAAQGGLIAAPVGGVALPVRLDDDECLVGNRGRCTRRDARHRIVAIAAQGPDRPWTCPVHTLAGDPGSSS